VLLILPGLVQTDPSRHLLRNAGRMKFDYDRATPPADVAAAILDALARNRTETVVGGQARWFLRFNRLFPRLMDRLIARRVRQLYAQ
jgi:short-subunit dehydrogenase